MKRCEYGTSFLSTYNFNFFPIIECLFIMSNYIKLETTNYFLLFISPNFDFVDLFRADLILVMQNGLFC